MPKSKPVVAIITPHLAQSNMGNWHTAARWARFLRERYRVRVLDRWRGEPADALIALHARRSAPSIAAWAAQFPGKPLIVVLTGTDLYRDIADDEEAQRSLSLATRLIVLNELGHRALPAKHRRKVAVVLQSAAALPAVRRGPEKPARHFDVVVVGHLRHEKDPLTAMRAAGHIRSPSSIRIRHVGRTLDASLEQIARNMMASNPRYTWVGERTRAQARQLVRRARVLLHPSQMEGGAQAVIEAIRSGTPVIASRVDGNVGLLGVDYPGYFRVGDAVSCARLLQRAEREPAFLRTLRTACKKRAARFDPRRERASLLTIVGSELAHNSPPPSPRRPSR